MFWLWHKDRLLFYSVQRNSKFTSFSRNRKKKYWFQGWIASWQNILIISRISWNNFSKVFTLFFTVYYIFLNISVQVSASIFYAWRQFYLKAHLLLLSTRYIVLLPVIRWLPEDGDGSQVYHCVYLWDEASASVSLLKYINRSTSFGWNKIIFFWLMAFEIAFPWPLAWFFFFSVSWQTQQFCGNSWYTRHHKITI